MSTTQFFASVVSSLAWPAAVIIAIWVLRGPIGELLRALRSAKGLGWQFDFERALSQVRELTPEVSSVEPNGKRALSGAELLRLAELAPRSVVDDAWERLQSAFVQRAGGIADFPALERQGDRVLDEGALPAYEILRGLHREATLSPGVDVTPREALEFARLAQQLEASMSSPDALDGGPK